MEVDNNHGSQMLTKAKVGLLCIERSEHGSFHFYIF